MAKMVPKEYHTTHWKMSWLRVCCSDVSPVISMIALIKFHSTGHYLCCTNPSGTLPSDVAERFKVPRGKINMAANEPNWLQLRLTPSSCGAADGRKLSPNKKYLLTGHLWPIETEFAQIPVPYYVNYLHKICLLASFPECTIFKWLSCLA